MFWLGSAELALELVVDPEKCVWNQSGAVRIHRCS